MMKGHYKTRGADAPCPPFLIHSLASSELKTILADAGWEHVKYKEQPTWLRTQDIEKWVQLAWSFLAAPVGGWTVADEEKWDEAIKEVVLSLEGMEGYQVVDGEHRIKMVACIAIYEKES